MAQKLSCYPTAIDLFAGAGGLSEGLRQAGFRVLAAVDIEPLAGEAYRANHREVKFYEQDIRTLSPKAMMRELGVGPGGIDLVAGCPPCQGFSTLRTRNGGRVIIDEQNDLVFQYLRFVKELRPKRLMFENVPALRSDERMVRVMRELEAVGYRCTPAILDAADYGVPQRRRRLIMLGGYATEVALAATQLARVTVRDAIGHLPVPGSNGDRLHVSTERRSQRVLELIRRIPKDGGRRGSLPKDQQLACHQRTDGFRDVYGRMAWDGPAPTITGGCINPSKGRFLHPTENRAITLREAALLQSFPPQYIFPLSRGRFRTASLIGNALPPEFIRRHAEQLLKAL